LASSAAALKAAGLHRLNVSMDTLDRKRYARITGRDRLGDVIDGLTAAAAAGLGPIKTNTVLMPGVNADEVLSLVRWALKRGYQPRFIEQMPLGPKDTWQRAEMVTAEDILIALQAEFTLIPHSSKARGSAPAEIWTVSGAEVPAGFTATVGIIASVTKPFCETCNRTRLTADGQLRSCLFARDETDVRSLLRSGASDLDIAELWRGAMAAKQPTHGIDEDSFVQPDRIMSAIGG
jgi:cyclic pyranopterin phosphate synthase